MALFETAKPESGSRSSALTAGRCAAQEADGEAAEPLLGEVAPLSWWQRAFWTVKYWVLPLGVLVFGLAVSGMALTPMIQEAVVSFTSRGGP